MQDIKEGGDVVQEQQQQQQQQQPQEREEQQMYSLLPLEKVPLDQIKPHPRNYRTHPEDEIKHLMESILSNGVYRNVVISQDGFALAGHGVLEAARHLELAYIPAYRVPYDAFDPRAIKLLVSDNEIAHLAQSDDRLLSELLREVKETDITGLLGTGYDEMMLANLVYVTRPASEVRDLDAAAQWVGMPEYDLKNDDQHAQVIVNFAYEADQREFCRRLDIDMSAMMQEGGHFTKSIWWPQKQRKDDIASLRFTSSPREATETEEEEETL